MPRWAGLCKGFSGPFVDVHLAGGVFLPRQLPLLDHQINKTGLRFLCDTSLGLGSPDQVSVLGYFL